VNLQTLQEMKNYFEACTQAAGLTFIAPVKQSSVFGLRPIISLFFPPLFHLTAGG
jgi:hypothetical protein